MDPRLVNLDPNRFLNSALSHLPVFEHPMLPLSIEGMTEFELPIRVGFVFETTLAATRLIYSGIFEPPIKVFIL